MPATAVIAAHCDGYCGRTSATMRTARSRSSSGYLLTRPITQILPRSGASGNAGTGQRAAPPANSNEAGNHPSGLFGLNDRSDPKLALFLIGEPMQSVLNPLTARRGSCMTDLLAFAKAMRPLCVSVSRRHGFFLTRRPSAPGPLL